jgi:hypothetical protein
MLSSGLETVFFRKKHPVSEGFPDPNITAQFWFARKFSPV